MLQQIAKTALNPVYLKKPHAGGRHDKQPLHAEPVDEGRRGAGREDQDDGDNDGAECGRQLGACLEEDALRVEDDDVDAAQLLAGDQTAREQQSLARGGRRQQVQQSTRLVLRCRH